MNEQQIKALMQESKINTSEDFSDRLMRRFETQTAGEPPFSWPSHLIFICTSFACLITGGGTALLSQISPGFLQVPFIAGSAFAVLWLIRYLLQLKADYRQLNDKYQTDQPAAG